MNKYISLASPSGQNVASILKYTRWTGSSTCRLTKKELCHSNETWHALNSTFPDTNCKISFQINLHWISTSGLWKVVLETFVNGPKDWRRESCFTRTMLLPTSLWLPWLLCVTVALNWFITLHIFLIWHHLILFCSPTWQYTWLGSSMRASLPQNSKCCNTDGRSMWTAGETMLKNKPHLVKFYHCIIVSLWTFQPTLIIRNITWRISLMFTNVHL